MEDLSLIPFDEGTDVLLPEPRAMEPVRPPSLPSAVEPVLDEVLPEPEPVVVIEEPRFVVQEWLNRLLAPAIVLLTAIVVYRIFF